MVNMSIVDFRKFQKECSRILTGLVTGVKSARKEKKNFHVNLGVYQLETSI